MVLKNIQCNKEENYFDANKTFFTNDELPSLSVILSFSLKCRIVQKAIDDTIKEHLFGPDMTSTDENSPHSPESGEEGNSQLYIEEFFIETNRGMFGIKQVVDVSNVCASSVLSSALTKG